MTRKQKKVEPQTLIYCGPTLKNGEISQFSLYQGELPANAKKIIGENEYLNELFVPVEEFSQFRNQISIQGTFENQLFMKAMKFVKGGIK